ncbi:ferredoxin [Streptomyces shenzhenensis]|uniref:ferredoxin n=1 Tax=Streptomyces shenzhenensis TaxID=943815 RepID=UPI0015F062F6|nr:ferredoxin [Streptomyces shenzhenensis]
MSTTVKVTVDMNLCESHGQCVFAAPEVFSFDDDDRLVHDAEPDPARYDEVVRAAAACPVRAITVEKSP